MAPPPCLRRGSKSRSWCAATGPVAGTDAGETLKQHLDVMLSRLYRLSTTHKKIRLFRYQELRSPCSIFDLRYLLSRRSRNAF